MDLGSLVNSVYSEISKLIPRKEKIEDVTVSNVKAIKDITSEMTAASLAGSNFVRLAGLSGGIAVAMSAYGAHAFNSVTEDDEEGLRRRLVFDSGNKMHLIHSVALLGVPLTRRPKLIGTAMVTGMTLFSGTCYYQAITGDRRVRVATPYGGMLLILAWFLMIL